jgi:glycosyltransferase involved in cell wall biosynthesis
MTRILAVVGATREHVLLDALGQLRAAGATISVVVNFDVSEISVDPALADVRELNTDKAEFPLRVRMASGNRRLWTKIRRDRWVRSRARHADVLVALDRSAIHAVWELAQRNPRPAAVYGLAPAVEAVEAVEAERAEFAADRLAGAPAVAIRRPTVSQAMAAFGRAVLRDVRDDTRLAAKVGALAAVSPRAMRVPPVAAVWNAIVAAPGIPDRVRAKLAVRVHRSMIQAGRSMPATSPPAGRITNDRTRADVLMRTALLGTAAGDATSVPEAAAALLAMADGAYADGKNFRAATDLQHTASIVFHRGLHFDSMTSPLMDDPDTFLAGWRASTAAQALWAPRERVATATPAPTDRPMRLLIATAGNANFLDEIRERYANMPGVEVRYLDLSEDPQIRKAQNDVRGMMEHLLSGLSPYGNQISEVLGPHIDWADTVFIDWCVSAAVMFTMIDPGTTRIIIRLHSFEAFSWWPHLVDFSRVDDLVLVSDHLRDLCNEVLPQLTDGPRQHVISNAMDLRSYVRPKDDDARFTLALVGIGSVAKDPRWAIDVLRELRKHDERYRLVLMGDDPEPKHGKAARDYYEALVADYEELEPSGAVVRLGQVTDVAKALVEVGVILSTSLRESFHCALVEGAASGAVPVVRNWPFFAGKEHGAHTLYPDDWLVDSPRAAAERILAMTSSAPKWRAAGGSASAYVLATWDWSIVSGDFDRLLLPGAAGETLPYTSS